MSESVLTVSECHLPVPDTAGHASFRSFDPSHPLCPLQLDACVDWNADTGATSYMTPHRHWMRNYFALLTLLTLCAHCNLMHVLIGMQTLVQPPI